MVERCVAALVVGLVATSAAARRPHVIEMKDPAGEPYLDAARALVKAIAANDPKAIDRAFTGTGDDRKLLDATVATTAATAAFTDAMAARFGASAVPARERHPLDGELRSIGVQTVVVDRDAPDRASISPGSFPFVGYELARADGRWTVTSVTVFPKDGPAMLEAHRRLTAGFDRLTQRVKAGHFTTAEAAAKAARAELGPVMEAYQAATRKGPPPATRNPITGEPGPATPGRAGPPATRP